MTTISSYVPMADGTAPERVAVAGDWHGHTNWAIPTLKAIKNEGITTVYHVGDFGFWPGRDGEKYLRGLERQLKLYGMTIYVTLGNHDDYAQTNALPVSEDGLQWATEHIAVMPRGHKWEINGRSFISFGGAPSINFEDLKPGISWWPEEAITMGDVYRLMEKGQADVMITHDAPDGIPTLDKMMAENLHEWSNKPKGIAYAAQGRAMMNQAILSVKPKMFIHGHYHKDYVENVSFDDWDGAFETTCVGLNRNEFEKNVTILNVDTLETQWLTIKGVFERKSDYGQLRT